MPAPKSRKQLRDRARVESGLRGSQYYTEEDWNRVIQDGVDDYWRVVTRGDEGYGVTPPLDLPCTPNQEFVLLPSDHQATRFLDRPTSSTNGEYREAEQRHYRWWRENFNQLAESTGTDIERPGIYWYREASPRNAAQKQIVLRPIPKIAEVLQLRYVPIAPQLTSDDDTIDTIAGFGDYIVDFVIYRYAQDANRKSAAASRMMESLKALRDWDGNRDRQTPDLLVHYQSGWQYQR